MKKFLSCDWGTSSFRLRLVDLDSQKILDEITSEQGIAVTHAEWLTTGGDESQKEAFYKGVITKAMRMIPGAQDEQIPIILSGMASSSVGISSLSYASFPFAWNPAELIVKKFEPDEEFHHPMYLVSGLKTKTDIMRGEETILLGCEVRAEVQTILIFPGTHSKHVTVRDGIAIDFKTYTTGELFNLLVRESILKNSVEPGDDPESFDLGIREALTGNLLNTIFKVRTRHLLDDSLPVSNYQYLSGLVIGAELKDLCGTRATLAVVSDGALLKSYHHALQVINGDGKISSINAREAFIRGHCKLAEKFLLPG